MLSTFGVFWVAEGLGVSWPGGALAIIPIFVLFVGVTALAVRFVRKAVAGGRVVTEIV